MAKILLQRDINKKYKNKQPQTKKHNMTEYRKKCYSSQEWKHLRQTQVFNHPLCELSLVDDVIKPAVDVHHLISPFQSASSVEECWLLFLDPDNIISLDKVIHSYVHNNLSALTETQQKYLKERINKVREKYGWRY